ncbi:uncharacterized protein [Physcomitrium patens]|uniref:Uncharacterized protein n=1 Tax=Physcomitrium patens TaxID=3218 RepID=A0A2K1JL77_PHYPA|nr:uncharacterized protein LOC112290317 isoform X1 [Physcomitrium patens]XP_024392237.1 uncharacterized protein LOC112290317 isoform X1 [Physcomitrium patens]PNR42281.1 hypothetical protein PHYPA_017110 [Physcomitrium patens]|eukprot:XP_024392236.1 uncharacterized protein LOC112290317 isoform X1 [Physcomitrella patens]
MAESDVPWNGVVKKTVSSPLDKVWDVESEFLDFPNLLTLEPVERENRVLGCTKKVTDLPGRMGTDADQWAKQKLVVINPSEHVFSYESLENNTGVDLGYYSAFQAKQEEDGKTLVRWAFRFSPSQAGCDRFVPFVVTGTNLYGQELEKLAATASPASVLVF